jgi:hypothetical protein
VGNEDRESTSRFTSIRPRGAWAPSRPPWYRSKTMGAAEKSYDEIVDLFARGGGAGAVLAFRPSPEAKARVQELLERSKRDGLSVDEQAELDRFGELEHLMQLVKVRARRFAT